MSRFEDSLREKFHRNDYSHGSTYKDERGNTFMDDHINGVDWHVPNRDDDED